MFNIYGILIWASQKPQKIEKNSLWKYPSSETHSGVGEFPPSPPLNAIWKTLPFENFEINFVKFAQNPKRFRHRCLVGSLPFWIPVNIVLAKIWNSKSKTILMINREWKYNLRDFEDPVKLLWWSFFVKIVNSF